MTDAATNRQILAAEPDRSTWLSANAGSGKTSVLTNRVARLLLRGVKPGNILCLTYTKAAASEMQNRLFQTLGKWAMLDDADLKQALTDLGEPATNELSRARTLFARAIDTPGGLKIQTIHSLCAAILRQFPLEAGVNPQFREMDTPQQLEVIEMVLEQLAQNHPNTLQAVAEFYSDDLASLGFDVAGKAQNFSEKQSKADIYRAFGLQIDANEERIAHDVVSADDLQFLMSLVPMLNQGSTNDQKLAAAIASLKDDRTTIFFELEKLFLTQKKTLKVSQPTKAVREGPAFVPLLSGFENIRLRVERASVRIRDLRSARQTVSIQNFANVFLPGYEKAKQTHGFLDFDDLIHRTHALLTSPAQQWVLYRLDGKIDHILVDEAQDTSPIQWDVIEALAEEMTSGDTGYPQTLFVVGDKKQSIYSFQGADAAGFDSRAERFRERLAGGQGLRPANLEYSFRSSPAILNVVDQVFNAGEIAGLGADHKAYHGDMPGRVDLWPLIPRPDKADEVKWSETGDRRVDNSAAFQLAEAVADQIEELIKKGTIQGQNGPKTIESGDIMVLVQRRSALFDNIIQACKSRDLDIAGADRLKLGSELAVRDLLALLSFLALPDDSLSLAAALRSPLFGWSEKDLYNLATTRRQKTPLWAALRRDARFSESYETLADLRGKVDFSRPYELLELILTRYQGRSKLLARLGPEAEDGINELLNQALAHERDTVPSLTGFVNAAKAADIEVKRQSDTTGNMIRVMTVHGAKGLESPIVILPDTTFAGRNQSTNLLDAEGLPLYPTKTDDAPPIVQNARLRQQAADKEERNRLLYVAMTRAEKWLIVCGIEPAPNQGKATNWHETVRTGLERAGAVPHAFEVGEGLRFALGIWPEGAEKPGLETNSVAADSGLTFGAAPHLKIKEQLIAPSELPGRKALGGDGLSEDEAKRKGRQIHLLLEHIGSCDDAESVAKGLLSYGPDAAEPDEIPALLAEAQSAMAAHPHIFALEALAEVSIVADIPSLNARMSGTVDRLLISQGTVLAVDFKTNAVVPATPADTPDGILRQMGAYLEGLEQIYPDHRIELAILWTANATLMPLEHGIVREVLQQTPTS